MMKEEQGIILRLQKNGILSLPAHLLQRLGLKENDVLKVISQNRQYLFLRKESASFGNSHQEGTVTFCGNIEGFGIAELFSVLNMTQKTGILIVFSGQAVKTIYFRKGEIIFASSNLSEDRLGNILYRTGRLSKEQLEEAGKSIAPD